MVIVVILVGKGVHTFRANAGVVGAAGAALCGAFVFAEGEPNNRVVPVPRKLLRNRVVGV